MYHALCGTFHNEHYCPLVCSRGRFAFHNKHYCSLVCSSGRFAFHNKHYCSLVCSSGRFAFHNKHYRSLVCSSGRVAVHSKHYCPLVCSRGRFALSFTMIIIVFLSVPVGVSLGPSQLGFNDASNVDLNFDVNFGDGFNSFDPLLDSGNINVDFNVDLGGMKYNKSPLTFISRYLQQHLASTAASICLQHGMLIGNRIWSWYSAAIDTDVASTRLKLASTLYCMGDLQMAADVLEDVERRYDNSVQAICGCGGLDLFNTKPLKLFTELLNEGDIDVALANRIAYCVRFLRQEAFCAPPIMYYEMVRAVGDDIQHRRPHERVWMNWAVVDALPFLHYLQYLTFRGLGRRHRQLQAGQSLKDNYVEGIRQDKLFHPETAANLLAHCFEMEGRIDDALNVYLMSQAGKPRNNAANWHIRRLTSAQR